MAITVYKYDDAGVPNLSAQPAGQSLQALLEHVLIDQGWTIVHDTTRRGTATTTDGRIIFERPDSDFVFWMDNEGSSDFTVGLADAGFPDGSLTHPQSGDRQSGSSTNLQKVDDSSTFYWGRWLALYDDASHTLIYRSCSVSDTAYGARSFNQPWGYIGTLATPASVAFELPVALVGRITTGSATDRNWMRYRQGTTLMRHDGSPSSDSTSIRDGAGFFDGNADLGGILTSGGPAFPYIPMSKVSVGCTSDLTGGSTSQWVDVGVLRGCFRTPSASSLEAYDFFEINFSTETDGANTIDDPLTVDGKVFYCIAVGINLFMSTDSADWVF
ncbi:hypothetical protein [Gilvimarinus sp. 1_MG-2023]|uniref:hypothetical protein n=1 Tax=Gilvimarinus sp. 1_MG-2023 TaxID=3062638 RepID=UPI0026E2BF3E|nr:hypothetical protein [Gilvimarinus sp. 1_MG-2023]MDO6747218.1 hypothetical protein [Gilvimarinus sp. 1_MG-2023]